MVYDFPTPQAAFAGGSELAAYLASGPGRVQFPNDAQHVIRQVGSTLVFYTWSPVNSPNGHAGRRRNGPGHARGRHPDRPLGRLARTPDAGGPA